MFTPHRTYQVYCQILSVLKLEISPALLLQRCSNNLLSVPLGSYHLLSLTTKVHHMLGRVHSAIRLGKTSIEAHGPKPVIRVYSADAFHYVILLTHLKTKYDKRCYYNVYILYVLHLITMGVISISLNIFSTAHIM